MKSKVFSVTQINTYIKRMFQSDYALRRISIKGQVSNCKYHSSGHIYFSLKDEESQISCVMFASARYNGLQFELEDGQEVIVDGNVSVYERGGSYQLYAQEIRLNGIGELYVAYEMLKQKLYEEGLFDHEIKKPSLVYGIIRLLWMQILLHILCLMHLRFLPIIILLVNQR